jgi:hypothetical protein
LVCAVEGVPVGVEVGAAEGLGVVVGVAAGVVVGVTAGVVVGVTAGVAGGVAEGLGAGAVVGLALGVAVGAAESVAVAVTEDAGVDIDAADGLESAVGVAWLCDPLKALPRSCWLATPGTCCLGGDIAEATAEATRMITSVATAAPMRCLRFIQGSVSLPVKAGLAWRPPFLSCRAFLLAALAYGTNKTC